MTTNLRAASIEISPIYSYNFYTNYEERKIIMRYFFGCSLFGFMLFAMTPASSMEGETYAAIAVSGNTLGYGYATNKATKKEAFSVAMKQCRKQGKSCKVQVWSTNCVAYARGNGDSWGTGWDKVKRRAKMAALQKCSEFDDGCQIKIAICN